MTSFRSTLPASPRDSGGTTELKRTALYARYSTDQQNPASIETQIDLGKEFAAKQGWSLLDIFIDAGISGASYETRPGLQSALSGARRGAYDILLCLTLDRLSRDLEHSARILKLLQFHDIALWTVHGGSAVSSMELGLRAVLSQEVLEQVRYRTREGMKTVAKNGRVQQLQDQARDAMLSASFAGVNLVYHDKTEPVKASEQVFSFVIGYANSKVQTMDVSAMDTLLLNDGFGVYPTSFPGQYNPEKTLFDGGEIIDAPGTFTPASVYWYNIPLSNPVTGDPEAYPVNPTYILQSIENHVVRQGADREGLYSNLVATIDNPMSRCIQVATRVSRPAHLRR